jgi:hypothetical protein
VRNFSNDYGKKGGRILASEAEAPVVGGPGSGNRYRFGSKQRVEDCLSLDVRSWRREGVLEPGRFANLTWHPRGRETSSIGVRTLHGVVELSYSVRSGGASGRKEDVRYTVPLTWTPCNFGGSRPWFVCPGRVNGVACGRRVAKLYLRHRYFLCRHCHDLTYASRQDTDRDAALRKCRRIRWKLGGSADLTEPFPKRPKGMHLRTYVRLIAEYGKAYEKFIRALTEDAERLTARVLGGPRGKP